MVLILGAVQIAMRYQHGAQLVITARQIVLPAAIARILFSQFLQNLERTLISGLSAIQIPLRHQQMPSLLWPPAHLAFAYDQPAVIYQVRPNFSTQRFCLLFVLGDSVGADLHLTYRPDTSFRDTQPARER